MSNTSTRPLQQLSAPCEELPRANAFDPACRAAEAVLRSVGDHHPQCILATEWVIYRLSTYLTQRLIKAVRFSSPFPLTKGACSDRQLIAHVRVTTSGHSCCNTMATFSADITDFSEHHRHGKYHPIISRKTEQSTHEADSVVKKILMPA